MRSLPSSFARFLEIRAVALLSTCVLLLPSASDAQVQFAELGVQHVPRLPRFGSTSRAVGDVDGDGDLDIVRLRALGSPAPQIQVLSNDGSAIFAEARLDPAGNSNLQRAHLSDLDRDGDLDLLVQSTPALLYWNDGTGRFQLASGIPIPSAAYWNTGVTLADLNGDAAEDAVFGGFRDPFGPSQQTLLYLNRGNGTFVDVTSTHLPLTTGDIFSIVADDLDGDGDRDLVVVDWNYGSGRAELWRNDGTGRFQADLAAIVAIRGVGVVCSGDLDRDGDLDLAFTYRSSQGGTSWLTNDGSGRFAPGATALISIRGGYDLALLDIEGDGDLDCLCAQTDERIVSDTLFVNDGSGRFADESTRRLQPDAIVASGIDTADFDGDGDVDVLDGGYDPNLYLNDGSGNFVQTTTLPAARAFPGYPLVVGDVDGDGFADVVEHYGYGLRLFRSIFGTRFRDESARRLPAGTYFGVPAALADLDQDGDRDLLTIVEGVYYGLRALKNDGSGVFAMTPNFSFPERRTEIVGLAVADVDGDADQDIIGSDLEDLFYYRNDLGGHFTDVTTLTIPPLGAYPGTIALKDMDRDFDLDVVVTSMYWPNLTPRSRLLANDGTGRFSAVATTGFPSQGVELSDVDQDGRPDLYAMWGLPWTDLLFVNQGNGRFVATGLPGRAFGWGTFADFDDDGDLDLLRQTTFNIEIFENRGFGALAAGVPATSLPNRCLSPMDLDLDGDTDFFVPTTANNDPWTVVHNLTRQLRSVRLQRVGYEGEWLFQGRPGDIALGWLSLRTIPRLDTPLGGLHLDPTSWFHFATRTIGSSGSHALALPIPGDPLLVGLNLYAQALIGPPGRPAEQRLTGLHEDRIVSL